MGPEDSQDGISVINVDGSGRTIVTATGTAADDDVPTWSPDGGRILFLRDDAPGYKLFSIAADGSGPREIAKIADSTDEMIRPGWSPDGKSIVFEDTAPPDNARDIYVIHADGSGRVRLGAPGRPVQDYQPSWSPDGGSIAYVEEASPDVAIFVMNADGRGARRLSTPSAKDTWPAWSPNGGRLVFERPGTAGGDIVVGGLDLGLTGSFHTPSWSTAPSAVDVHVPALPTPASPASLTP